MIPLSDANPARSVPGVNLLLILANISVFVYQHYCAPAGPEALLGRLGFIPYELFHGVDIGPRNLVPAPLTVVTAMFMHGGWLHLLGNMLYLWIFGDNIEDRLGHLRYLVFYTICGLTAAGVHGLVNINSRVPTIGASGAIAGILGAYLLLFPGAKINTLFIIVIFIRIIKVPAFILLGYWILIQILSGFAEYGTPAEGGIAWFAHSGGFICGLVLIILMRRRKGWRRRRTAAPSRSS
ncbi:MAG: rhomboid family intramembrane serine protease [Desulfobacterales bacterium]|nr:MAG: rhomboid family intramembrane serine protease [Desulfobacterales bacterium]